MKAVESLAPGFIPALRSMPGMEEAWTSLAQAAQEARFLSATSMALVGVVSARRMGSRYARWAMERAAANAGASAEQILFATCGAATDPGQRQLLRAAWAMLATQRGAPRLECPPELARLLGERAVAELAAVVALSIIACRALDRAAPEAAAVRGA